MDDYLSNKPDNFLDDPEKLYMLRRREEHQAKKLDFVDSKSEDEGSKEYPKNSPPQSPRENRLPPMGDQPLECNIRELCTLDIIDLPDPHGDRKAVRDQDHNNLHSATFTFHR
jgi:hypothetical protein